MRCETNLEEGGAGERAAAAEAEIGIRDQGSGIGIRRLDDETTSRSGAVMTMLGAIAVAQQAPARPMSPEGSAQVQVLGTWTKPARPAFTLGRETYQGGKWIEIRYGRPLQRGRDLFGSGANYGKAANDVGAPGFPAPPVWRAGANKSTRLNDRSAADVRQDDGAGRRIQPVHRSQAAGVDADHLELAGAGQVRSQGQGGVVGRVRLHARQGRRARADEARQAALRSRSADLDASST